MKKRINITIGPELHASAVEHAKNLETDFSGLISELLRKELRRTPARAPAETKEAAVNWGKTPRNAPCPCGSRRKFKLCHGNPEP